MSRLSKALIAAGTKTMSRGNNRLLETVLFTLDGLRHDELIEFTKRLGEYQDLKLQKAIKQYPEKELRTFLEHYVGKLFRDNPHSLKSLKNLLFAYMEEEVKRRRTG